MNQHTSPDRVFFPALVHVPMVQRVLVFCCHVHLDVDIRTPMGLERRTNEWTFLAIGM